jgi:hypothetical protein
MRLAFNCCLNISGLLLTSLLCCAAYAAELPAPWFMKGDKIESYDAGVDPAVVRDGKPSAFLKSKADKIDGLATIKQRFSADKYRGKRLKVSAWLKTSNVKDAAGVWLRIDGNEHKMLAFDNMENRPVKGTTDWKQYSCVLDVPEFAHSIHFGFLLFDTGEVWANSFQLQVVSNDVPTTDLLGIKDERLAPEPVNLDFSEKK